MSDTSVKCQTRVNDIFDNQDVFAIDRLLGIHDNLYGSLASKKLQKKLLTELLDSSP